MLTDDGRTTDAGVTGILLAHQWAFGSGELIMSRGMRFPTTWYVRPAKAQTSLLIRTVWSEPLLVAWVFYDCLATDWTFFGVSKLKRRLRLHNVKMPHCWKSHAQARMVDIRTGIHKLLVRIANREDSDQTASSGSTLFVLAFLAGK